MKTELVFVPLPAAGHLVSTVQFAKLLVERDEQLSIKFLIFNLPFDAGASSYVQSLLSESTTKGIDYIQLSDPKPQNESSESQQPNDPLALLFRMIESQKPQIRKIVAALKESSGSSRLAGFVIDTFCVPMIDVANEFELPTYIFYTSGAAMIGFRHHLLSLLDEKCDLSQYQDSDLAFSVSTYINPVPVKQWPSSTLDANSLIIGCSRRWIGESKGIIVNSFFDLESYAIQALHKNQSLPTIYPVGPLINLHGIRNNPEDSNTVLKWLDDQPVSSVIFLCFGSFGSFDEDQVKEIARALEQSGCRFLWSLRKAPPKGDMRGPSEYENYEKVLPEGFLDRTSGIGKLVGWAPQAQILAHPAVGGFVTHCGWNSVLESVWFGVPMATWPMYAEQQMNAFYLLRDLGISVEIKMDFKKDVLSGNHAILLADEIEVGIRKLMEFDGEIRRKVTDLREKARSALMEGGSSYLSLGRFIEDFRASQEDSH